MSSGTIVFVCPFRPSNITGGIKVIYKQANLLLEVGVDARVYNPLGPPNWIETHVPVFGDEEIGNLPADTTFVFNEIFRLSSDRILRHPGRRILYCQNQYYLSLGDQSPATIRKSFSHAVCPSEVASGYLRRIFGFERVEVVPPTIETGLFYPRNKSNSIVYFPQKMPREAKIIRLIFESKYPDLSDVSWTKINGMSEQQTAEILGTARVLLALGQMESLSLTPLEAMASGTLVVGCHGHGGLEYATTHNGLWFSPEHLEEIADALALTLRGIHKQEPWIVAMQEDCMRTVQRFTKSSTLDGLRRAFDI